MHFVLLGVGRQFLAYWLESPVSEFYVRNKIAELEEKLLALRQPKNARRMPRLFRKRKFWKAYELKNWFLYYSIPVLEGSSVSLYTLGGVTTCNAGEEDIHFGH
ncbi:unnamed protein product [Ixodes pacificus]